MNIQPKFISFESSERIFSHYDLKKIEKYKIHENIRNLYIERTLAINKTGFKMRTTWDTEKIRTDYER